MKRVKRALTHVRVKPETAALILRLRPTYCLNTRTSADNVIRGLWADACKWRAAERKRSNDEVKPMIIRAVAVRCFECHEPARRLFLSGKTGSYVTFICDHQKNYTHTKDEGEYWSSDVLTEAFTLREQGVPYAEITRKLNERFGTAFDGVQRPDGKGYRGAVTRKFARLTKCEWSPTDTDAALIANSTIAFNKNLSRKITSHDRN